MVWTLFLAGQIHTTYHLGMPSHILRIRLDNLVVLYPSIIVCPMGTSSCRMIRDPQY